MNQKVAGSAPSPARCYRRRSWTSSKQRGQSLFQDWFLPMCLKAGRPKYAPLAPTASTSTTPTPGPLGATHQRVAQFARYTHRKMREQAPIACFPTRMARHGRRRHRHRHCHHGTKTTPSTLATSRWCLTSKGKRQAFYPRVTQAGGSSDTTCRGTSGNTGPLLSLLHDNRRPWCTGTWAAQG